VRASVRIVVLMAIVAALAVGAWIAARAPGVDRRNVDALVTVGGDAVHDGLRPVMDLTRLSDAEEVELGTAIDREVRSHVEIVDDPALNQYVGDLVRRTRGGVIRRDIPYEGAVVRDDAVNAFAVAGGHVYVTTGMLRFVETEAELVSVIGHEIGHVDLRHCVERLQIGQAARRVAPGVDVLAQIGYELMRRGFSEEQELAADADGVRLAAIAGYDPWSAQAMFAKLLPRDTAAGRRPTRDPVAEAAAIIPDALSRYLATHPPADRRIEVVRRTLGNDETAWRGRRLYTGRSNLEERLSVDAAPREDEWVVRTEAPPPPPRTPA